MGQKCRYWTRRLLELVVIGYVLGIFVVAGAEAMHRPIVPDKVAK